MEVLYTSLEQTYTNNRIHIIDITFIQPLTFNYCEVLDLNNNKINITNVSYNLENNTADITISPNQLKLGDKFIVKFIAL